MSGQTPLRCATLFFLCTALVRFAWEEPTCFLPVRGQFYARATHKALAAARSSHGGPTREEAQLTKLIMASTSADVLLRLLEAPLATSLVNHVHVGAALTMLAKLQHSTSMTMTARNVAQVDALSQVALDALQRGTVSARQVANVFWSVAKLHRSLPQLRSLEPALLDRVECCAANMAPQAVANVIWACATLRLQRSQLQQVLPPLTQQAVAVAGDFIPQHLANIFWSAATLRKAAPELLAVLPELQGAAADKARDFNPQAVANSLWATATLQALAPSLQNLLPALIDRAQEIGPDMASQSLANTIWAAAKLRQHHAKFDKLLPGLVTLAAGRKDMKAQELANVLWALALVGLVDKDFMLAAARRTTMLAPKMSDRSADLDLPQIVLAFAKLGFRSPKMLTAVRERLTRGLGQVNSWGLCALVWSYDELDPDEVFATFRRQLRQEASRRKLSEKQIASSQQGPWASRRRRR